MSDAKQRAWYAALERMIGGMTSAEVADVLIAAGLVKSTKPNTVAAHVRACMSPSKPDFFKMSELVVLTNYTQRYHAVAFMCQETGCKLPVLLSGERAADAVPAPAGVDIMKLNTLRELDRERRSKPALTEQALFSQENTGS